MIKSVKSQQHLPFPIVHMWNKKILYICDHFSFTAIFTLQYLHKFKDFLRYKIVTLNADDLAFWHLQGPAVQRL